MPQKHAVPSSITASAPKFALNVSEVAHATGLLPWQINEAIAAGALPAKVLGRTRVVLVADILPWLQTLKDAAPKPWAIHRIEKSATTKEVAA